jgi:hypothetical protein
VQTPLLFYCDQLGLELETQAQGGTELDGFLDFDEGAKFRALVANEEPPVFEEQGAVAAADADFFHDDGAVTISA